MSISNNDISQKIIDETAALAKIKIDDDERLAVKDKLDRIFTLYQVMNDCDTSSVSLVDLQVNLISQLREDTVTEHDETSHLAKNFKSFNADTNMFEVPKVIEE